MGCRLGDSASLSFDPVAKAVSAYAPASYGTVSLFVASLDAPVSHIEAQIPAGQQWSSGPLDWFQSGDKYTFVLQDQQGNALATLSVDNMSGTPVISGGQGVSTQATSTTPPTSPASGQSTSPIVVAPVATSWFTEDSLGFGFSNLMYLLGGGAVILLMRKK